MKKIFLICVLLLCIANIVSCDTSHNMNSEKQGDTGHSTAKTTENTIGGQIDSDTIPLIFDNYGEFVEFAKERKIDETKYPDAKDMMWRYYLDEGVFVDIINDFELPPLAKNESESVVISSAQSNIINNNSFKYGVYSKDQQEKVVLKYSVNVIYVSQHTDVYYENTSKIQTLTPTDAKDIKDGVFKYQTDNEMLIYYKRDYKYYNISLNTDTHSFDFSFGEEAYSSKEIREICGERVYETFFGDIQTDVNGEQELN